MSKPKWAYVPLDNDELIDFDTGYFTSPYRDGDPCEGDFIMAPDYFWKERTQASVGWRYFRRIDLNQYKKIKSK